MGTLQPAPLIVLFLQALTFHVAVFAQEERLSYADYFPKHDEEGTLLGESIKYDSPELVYPPKYNDEDNVISEDESYPKVGDTPKIDETSTGYDTFDKYEGEVGVLPENGPPPDDEYSPKSQEGESVPSEDGPQPGAPHDSKQDEADSAPPLPGTQGEGNGLGDTDPYPTSDHEVDLPPVSEEDIPNVEGQQDDSQQACDYGDLNDLSELLIRNVRPLIPDTVVLPDLKLGPFMFRSFSIQSLSKFGRRTYPAVACSEKGIGLVIPLHWEEPLVGSFELEFSRFKTPVKVFLERLEAEIVVDIPFDEGPRYVAHVRKVRFTRSYDPRVVTNFGYFRSASNKLGTWLAKVFQARIRDFLSIEFQDILDEKMLQVQIDLKTGSKEVSYM